MEFYVVERHPKGESERFRTDFSYDESVGKGNAEKCPKCGGFITMLPPLPPYVVHLETWGEDFGDVAFGPTDILVSARFKDTYERSGLRGLKGFESVAVASHNNHGAEKGPVPEYFRSTPSQNAARIDVRASGVEWKEGREPTCDECLGGIIKRWRRIVIDESSWKGDDIFYAYGIPGELIVSERFFEWVRENGFRNLVLEPALQSGHDFYPWEIASNRGDNRRDN